MVGLPAMLSVSVSTGKETGAKLSRVNAGTEQIMVGHQRMQKISANTSGTLTLHFSAFWAAQYWLRA